MGRECFEQLFLFPFTYLEDDSEGGCRGIYF